VPVWGKLSDLFGRRRLFQIGVAVFLLGSLACGIAQTMTQLIFARAFQGIGAGALVPLAMTIIGDIFTLEERAAGSLFRRLGRLQRLRPAPRRWLSSLRSASRAAA
jgi:MFS family permease